MTVATDIATPRPDLEQLERQVRAIERCGERMVVEADGTSIVWHRWGQGPNLILVHGAYGSWTHWIRNVQELAQHYTVWAPDVPSFGESDQLDPGDDNVIRAAALLSSCFRQIAPVDQKVELVGFSFGGRIAAEMAAELGERVSKVVFVAPGGFAERAIQTRLPKRWRTAGSVEELWEIQRYNLEVIMFADPARIDNMAVYLHMKNAAAARVRPGRPDPAILLGALGGVRAPMRAIWGDHDTYHLGLVEKRLAILRSFDPGLQSRIIPMGGHWVMYEDAETFNAALLDLLAS